ETTDHWRRNVVAPQEGEQSNDAEARKETDPGEGKRLYLIELEHVSTPQQERTRGRLNDAPALAGSNVAAAPDASARRQQYPTFEPRAFRVILLEPQGSIQIDECRMPSDVEGRCDAERRADHAAHHDLKARGLRHI